MPFVSLKMAMGTDEEQVDRLAALSTTTATLASDAPGCAPAFPIVPVLGILSCLALMVALPLDTWLRLLIWTGIGLAIYFAYGAKHARHD